MLKLCGQTVNWEAVLRESPFPGVTVRQARTRYVTVSRCEFEPGATWPARERVGERLLLVVHGELRLRVETGSKLLGPGETARLPAGTSAALETGRGCTFYELATM